MDRILILDFGSQYTQLITRRVREAHVYSEIQPCTWTPEQIRAFAPKGIILSGGPASVNDRDSPVLHRAVLELGVPVLGICYGMQAMAKVLGGVVGRGTGREYGKAEVECDCASLLFQDLNQRRTKNEERRTIVWMSHGDRVSQLPQGFRAIATSRNGVIAAMGDDVRTLYGLQFHPEVVHTERGKELLGNFLFAICNCAANWSMGSFIESETARIRTQVGNGKVVCGVSGGVDSSVVAALLHRAIGDQLTCIFVDNGVMRKDEGAKIPRLFRERLGIRIVAVDAAERFLNVLDGIDDPERKRKLIGHEFIAVFEEEARKVGVHQPHSGGEGGAQQALPASSEKGNRERNVFAGVHGTPFATSRGGATRAPVTDEARKVGGAQFLAQGTLYPDVIESVSLKGPSATIKSHHNVGGLPEKMGLKLVEPLRELFKDEVRELGRELGMPEELIQRQPFPGPGLAVRILGAVTRERLAILREADDVMMQEIKTAGWYEKVWQGFCVLLPVKTVGVMGDERTYENVIAVRAVTSQDGMTADWVPLPYELLGRISSRIINEVKGVNRVVYDISSKPPATIEWE